MTNQKADRFERVIAHATGVIDHDGQVRLYYWDMDPPNKDSRTWLVESADLKSWSTPVQVTVNENPTTHWRQRGWVSVFYHEGWKGYMSDAGAMHLLTSDDGLTFRPVGKAFDWKMDTLFSCFHDGARYVMYGRVRGRSAAGGFAGGIDRRGISMHTSREWAPGTWESKVIADPADYFDYSKPVKPDFYTPAILPDGRGFTAVFWKDDRRVPATRPERTTGELYSIRTRVTNGDQFEVVSMESVIPRKFHLRKSTYSKPTYTEAEVGQIYVYPAIVERGGKQYVFYTYQDDTHYERRDDLQHETSIYVFQLN